MPSLPVALKRGARPDGTAAIPRGVAPSRVAATISASALTFSPEITISSVWLPIKG
jgi:hypothetical protein